MATIATPTPTARPNVPEVHCKMGGGAQNRSSTPAPRSTVNAARPNGTGKHEAPRAGQQDIGRNGTSSKGVTALNEQVLRAGFMRKVYGILTFQMLLTVAIAGMCMATPAIRSTFVYISQSHILWLKCAMFLPTAASLFALKLSARNYPANYILMFIFTLSMSVKVGFVCAIFQEAGYGHTVLQAFAATAVIFMGLSVYTLLSGKDFSFIGGFLSVALWGLVITGLVGVFWPSMVHSLAYGFAGALIFCGYILYDTWRLQKQFSYDDYIGATIELYLDIVNLFLYILQILAKKKKSKN